MTTHECDKYDEDLLRAFSRGDDLPEGAEEHILGCEVCSRRAHELQVAEMLSAEVREPVTLVREEEEEVALADSDVEAVLTAMLVGMSAPAQAPRNAAERLAAELLRDARTPGPLRQLIVAEALEADGGQDMRAAVAQEGEPGPTAEMGVTVLARAAQHGTERPLPTEADPKVGREVQVYLVRRPFLSPDGRVEIAFTVEGIESPTPTPVDVSVYEGIVTEDEFRPVTLVGTLRLQGPPYTHRTTLQLPREALERPYWAELRRSKGASAADAPVPLGFKVRRAEQ